MKKNILEISHKVENITNDTVLMLKVSQRNPDDSNFSFLFSLLFLPVLIYMTQKVKLSKAWEKNGYPSDSFRHFTVLIY